MVFVNALLRSCQVKSTRNEIRHMVGLNNVIKKLRESSIKNPDLLYQFDLYEDQKENDVEEEDLSTKLKRDESMEFFEKLKTQIKQSNNPIISFYGRSYMV